jgi:hypothetical protein
MRTKPALLTLLIALIHAGVASAQSLPYNIVDCEGDNRPSQITSAVDAALQRLVEAEDLAGSNPNAFLSALDNAFGHWSTTPYDYQAFLVFIVTHTNIRAVLTNTTGAALSGTAPVFPRVTFRCAFADTGNAATRAGSTITLYPAFFRDGETPLRGNWNWTSATRIGTILHEAVHLAGGPDDIADRAHEQGAMAVVLADNLDGRALSNAENYERFYTVPPFEQ